MTNDKVVPKQIETSLSPPTRPILQTFMGITPTDDAAPLNELDVADYQKFIERKALYPQQVAEYNHRQFMRKLGAVAAAVEQGEEERQNKRNTSEAPGISTMDVISSFMRVQENTGLKKSSLQTYLKNLLHFARHFHYMPTELTPLLDYLAQFSGETGRYRKDQQLRISALYEYGVKYCGVPKNPLKGLPLPKVRQQRITTANLNQVAVILEIPETLTEKVASELTVGHGWRQIEVRRITAGDVRQAHDNIIWCRGKQREEDAPILTCTLNLLSELASPLADDQEVLRSSRIRSGLSQPFGEDGMNQLLSRLLIKAGLELHPHDLRRTFATLVQEASGDETLAMRLIRDQVKGVNNRYINYPVSKLVVALERYSPISQVKKPRPLVKQAGEYLVETGESRTPRPIEATRNLLQDYSAL